MKILDRFRPARPAKLLSYTQSQVIHFGLKFIAALRSVQNTAEGLGPDFFKKLKKNRALCWQGGNKCPEGGYSRYNNICRQIKKTF